MASVVVYTADGCSLCERAIDVVRRVRAELEFELDVVDIDGDDLLERRYRALLPVVEVDGREAFVFEVDPDALREWLAGG